MKQVFLPILAATAFIVIVGVLFGNPQKRTLLFQNPTPTPTASSQKTIQIGSSSLKISLASTDEARRKGLSGMTSLPADEGMLFVFDQKGTSPAFWMKDMLIPLDIIWIKDGKVSQIDKNIEPPDKYTPDAGLKLYKPGSPINYVLEVNAGFSDSNKIKVGDKVNLSAI